LNPAIAIPARQRPSTLTAAPMTTAFLGVPTRRAYMNALAESHNQPLDLGARTRLWRNW
jgi:hypothetical protein